MAAESWYLWSNYQNGGETDEVRTPNGGTRNVVLSRNLIPAGTKVSKSDLEVDDAGWEALVEAGVVRSFPYPDMPAGSTDSPLVFLQRKLNEQAASEEELLTAQVQGATQTEEALVAAAAEVDKEAKAEEKKS
jgi:hypothetical protein